MEWERCVEGEVSQSVNGAQSPFTRFVCASSRRGGERLGDEAGGNCGLGSLWLCFFFPSPPGRGMTVLSMPLVAARVGSTNFSLIIFTTFSCVFFRCFPHRIFLVVFMLFHLRVKFSDKQHAPQWGGGAGEGVCHLTALTEHQREGRG